MLSTVSVRCLTTSLLNVTEELYSLAEKLIIAINTYPFFVAVFDETFLGICCMFFISCSL